MALRAVQAGEKVPPRTKSVDQAAKSGSRRELLESMRDRIAEAVADPKCPHRDLASLTKRLQDISRDLELLKAADDNQSSSDDVDDSFDPSAI